MSKRVTRPKRSGTVFRYAPAKPGEAHGHYVVRCSAPDGSRPLFHLDPAAESPAARKAALRDAKAISAELFRTGEGAAPRRKAEAPAAIAGETVSAYAARWFADRERRGLSSVDTDRGRFKNHVEPVIGSLPIVGALREQLRDVVERLDEKARAERLSWRTAVKVWGTVTKMFSDACDSKVAALRVRTDNPCAGLRGPDRGEKKAKQWLYPKEVTALLVCERVPVRWRRLYALATYLYVRPGELAALEWKDVQSEHAYVSIHQALNLRTGKVKPTKTGITRKVPIRPELAPLLDAMRAECDDKGRVIQHTHENKTAKHGLPPLEDLAATLRRHLSRAGVKRADLHDARNTTKRLTFYDLRATGITWEVLAGTDHVRVMQRAGHRNFATTQDYIREAEAMGIDAGAPFPPLPEVLSQELSQEAAAVAKNPKAFKKTGVPNGIRSRENMHDPAELGSNSDSASTANAPESDAKCLIAGERDRSCDSKMELDLDRATRLVQALDLLVSEPTARPLIGELRGILEAARGSVAEIKDLNVERARRKR